jgi:hypothetical protein
MGQAGDQMIQKAEDEKSNSPDFSRFLVDLIINQDHVAQNWIKFFVTIEAGLAVAFAFAFGQLLPAWFQRLAILLIPIMAIALAISLTLIVVRERQWQNLYIKKFNDLPGHSGLVFPVEADELGSEVGKPSYGTISWTVMFLAGVIISAWLSAFVVARGQLNQQAPPTAKPASRSP